MASRGVDPGTLAAMDWRDVGAALKAIGRAEPKQPPATLDEDTARGFRELMAQQEGLRADG